MGDLREAPRKRHGLIAVLVALRVTAERKRREEEAATKTGTAMGSAPNRKRGWFG